MVLLGIDPGLASTGFGVVEGDARAAVILDFGCIRTSPREEHSHRLTTIYTSILDLLRKWQPVGLSMEDVFSAPRIPKAALQLGEVRGVIALLAGQQNLRLMQLSAREVKQALTGSGAADKEQVERSLRRLTGRVEEIRPLHASDALAIAVVGLSRWNSAGTDDRMRSAEMEIVGAKARAMKTPIKKTLTMKTGSQKSPQNTGERT